MARITDLPAEILLRIFQFYLENENQCNLLTLSYVSKMWKAVCRSRELWMKFDGTIKFKQLKRLCSQGYLNSTKQLTISNTEKLNDEDAKKLFSCLENVETIDFSQVESFSKNVIPILAQSSLKLKEIQIGSVMQSKKGIVLRYSELIPLFMAKGKYLTTIKLSYCHVANLTQVLKCISVNCPQLEHLHFTNNIYLNNGLFPTEYFQSNCSKLRVLHLDHSISIAASKNGSGFPNLEVFSYNDLNSISHLKDNDIKRILFNSPKLKFLSLINCAISVDILCSLPAESVEYLFLPRSKVANSDNLEEVFKKWCHSLKQIDISYSSNMCINNALLILTTLPIELSVEFLDLSYTQVTSNTIINVLEKCKRLEMLYLTGCRNLSRGLKKNYIGEADLRTLSKKLKIFAYDDSTDEELSI